MSNDADTKHTAFREALLREKAELLALSEGAEDDRKAVTLDQQSVGRLSRMDAMQVQAMAKALDVRRRGRLALIDAALARMETGDYGYCLDCDEPIPAKRLEIDPAARLCVKCAG